MRVPRPRRLLLALVGASLLLGGAVTASTAAAARPDFALTGPASSLTVQQGTSISAAIGVTRTNGFSASVGLTLHGGPAGAQVSIAPSSNQKGAQPSSLMIATTLTTPVGVTSIVITGSSGSLTHTITIIVIVTAMPGSGFVISNSSGNANVTQGSVATFVIAIKRVRFTAAVTFSVTGVPAHSTATFTPISTTGNSTVLQIATTSGTPLGSYFPIVTGRAGTIAGSSTFVHLTVSAPVGPPRSFTIAGSADRLLSPGVTGRINLALTNPNNQPLDVTALVVSLTGVSTTGCATSNFSVGQYLGSYPLLIPAGTTLTLSQLGVPQSSWPSVGMIDLSSNQDICKATTLSLSYSGSGHSA